MDSGDDLIRRAIREFAYGDATHMQFDAPSRRRAARRQHGRWGRLLTAAVLALLLSGLVVWLALLRPVSAPPIDPTPTASPTPTLAYPLQTRAADDLPFGGTGDTVDGLTLTAVEITDAPCPDANDCPGAGILTVRNDTAQPIDAFVYFYVFRNNSPAVGEAARVSLTPGQEATVTIDVQPELADSAPVGRVGSIYSWNFAVEKT